MSTSWACVNAPMVTPSQSSAQSSLPRLPQWRPYCFPEGNLLVVSKQSVLKDANGKQLDLGKKAARTWTEELEVAHQRVLNIGGYEAYAHLLQATIEELVRKTVGVDDGHGKPPTPLEPGFATVPRPKAYKLEWFCLHVLWHQESQKWQLVTLLPAIKYPVVQSPGHRSHDGQFVLVRYRLGEADQEGAGDGHHSLVCAGPRFIRAQRKSTTSGGVNTYTECKWPTHYAETVMPKIQKKDSSFGPDTKFIRVPGPLDVSLECRVWPAGDPVQELYWPRLQPRHPPQQSIWGLQITSKPVEENTPLFTSDLDFSLHWPPALLERFFSVPESVYHPAPRAHPDVNIFNPPLLPPQMHHNSSLANPYVCREMWSRPSPE